MAKKRIVASTVNNGWVAPKVRKKRKPMTEEQKKAKRANLSVGGERREQEEG